MDTTVSEGTQRQWVANQMAGPADVNVFKAGFTYYTFLLYAKPTTQQTYQMYVGTKDFHSDTDVVAVQAHTESDPVAFDESPFPPSGSSWTKSYDCDSNPNNCKGILTVTMDMDFSDFKNNYGNAAEYNCQPATFCSWNGKACGCKLNSADSLFSQCQAVCSQWTNKDTKCPITVKTVDGNKVFQTACFGFGVKFPNSFAAADQVGVKPASACYPKNDDWNVPFQPADQDLAGTCYYKKAPQGTFCPQ
jgi:cell migration-inducing and hyaluronan-binding protein